MTMIAMSRLQQIVAEADRLSSEFSGPPIPVHEIAERNGVNVVVADFGNSSNAVSGYSEFEESKLYVNKDDGIMRQLYAIAHELGHWVLHRRIIEQDSDCYDALPRFYDPDRSEPLEREADIFAAHLMIPGHMLRYGLVRKVPAARLAGVFGVTVSLMEFRLRNRVPSRFKWNAATEWLGKRRGEVPA